MTRTTSIARRFALLLIFAAVCWLGFAYWENEVVWPDFPANKQAPLAPQAVLVVERDYGWRTGDAVPVDLYVRQQPGTRVDLDAIRLENAAGDFEVHEWCSEPRLRVESGGATLIKKHFMVQSLNYGETRALTLTLTYIDLKTHEVETVSTPGLVVHMSKTYDGRPDIQPLVPTLLLPVWDTVENGLLFLLAIAMFFGHAYLRALDDELNRPLVELTDRLKLDFAAIWARIEQGDAGKENYEELERLVRRLFDLEPQTRGQIERQVAEAHHRFESEIITIVSLCDKRLYDHQELSSEEHMAIQDAFVRILYDKPRRRPAVPIVPMPPPPSSPSSGGDAQADDEVARLEAQLNEQASKLAGGVVEPSKRSAPAAKDAEPETESESVEAPASKPADAEPESESVEAPASEPADAAAPPQVVSSASDRRKDLDKGQSPSFFSVLLLVCGLVPLYILIRTMAPAEPWGIVFLCAGFILLHLAVYRR